MRFLCSDVVTTLGHFGSVYRQFQPSPLSIWSDQRTLQDFMDGGLACADGSIRITQVEYVYGGVGDSEPLRTTARKTVSGLPDKTDVMRVQSDEMTIQGLATISDTSLCQSPDSSTTPSPRAAALYSDAYMIVQ